MDTDHFALHADLEERHWWFLGRREIVCRLAERLLEGASDPLILDAGCGTGGILSALAPRYPCLGLDPSAEAIRLAAERFPRVRFECHPLPDGLRSLERPPTVTLLLDVLEHVEDDAGFLAAAVSAMPPGAHLLITVPADQRLWSPHDVSFGHYRRYDAAQLAALWKDLPVTARLLSYYNARFYPVARAARMVSRWRGRAAGRANTDFQVPRWPVNGLCRRLFAGEAGVLLALLEGRRARGFARGVSLIAVLRREG